MRSALFPRAARARGASTVLARPAGRQSPSSSAPSAADPRYRAWWRSKVSLDALEAALAKSGDTVLLADADGVVFLSSEPAWHYRTLAPLPEPVRARLVETRQYGHASALPLAAVPQSTTASRRLVPIAANDGIVRERLQNIAGSGPLDWQLVVLAIRPCSGATRPLRGGRLAPCPLSLRLFRLLAEDFRRTGTAYRRTYPSTCRRRSTQPNLGEIRHILRQTRRYRPSLPCSARCRPAWDTSLTSCSPR